MSVTREKSTCAVRHPASRSWAACASSRLVFPYRRGATSRTPTRSPARRPSVVSSDCRSMRSSGATGPSKRNGVPCFIVGQDIPDQPVRQYLTASGSFAGCRFGLGGALARAAGRAVPAVLEARPDREDAQVVRQRSAREPVRGACEVLHRVLRRAVVELAQEEPDPRLAERLEAPARGP